MGPFTIWQPPHWLTSLGGWYRLHSSQRLSPWGERSVYCSAARADFSASLSPATSLQLSGSVFLPQAASAPATPTPRSGRSPSARTADRLETLSSRMFHLEN